MNTFKTNPDWLQLELQIENAKSAIRAENLNLLKLAKVQLHAETRAELMAMSDALSEAVEVISATLMAYKHEAQEQNA